MDICLVSTPQGSDFDSSRDDDPDESEVGTVSDDDYDEACLASSDLRELGLVVISPWAGWRVYHAQGQLFRDYRAARSAADLGRPESAARLQEASLRLVEEASRVLANSPVEAPISETEVAT